MLSVKQELLAALADALEQLSPGAGAKAAFESPKVAAHGDFACTAAMQLAKPLRLNPRQVAEALRAALLALPAYQRWVSDIDIAGPGFINIRLQPAAKQQIVSAVLQAGARFGFQAPRNERVLVEFVSANPTGPLHVGHGRQAALGDAICNLYATQGWQVYREFYYNDAGVQIATLANSTQLRAKGFKPGDAEWPEAAYNGEYIQDIANDFLAGKTVTSDDRAFTASGDIDDLDSIRQFAVAYLRHEQDLDLKAFPGPFRQLLPGVQPVHQRPRRGHGEPAGRQRQDLRAGWRAVAAVHRLRRRQGPRDAQGRWRLHLLRAGRGLPHHQVGARLHQGRQHPGHGPPRHDRAGARRPAGRQCWHPEGYPDYVLHTMVRVVKGGEEVKISKRAGSYVTLRDLIEWTSTDAVRFFLLSRKPDTEYTFDVDLAVQKNNDNPVYYVQYAHARICSVLAAWGGDASELGETDLSPLDSPAAQTLMLALAKYPEMLTAAAQDNAPHDVTFYLRDLAATYHSYYDAERILVDDEAIKRARLALIAATAQVLHNGLAVLGVSAPNRM
jgi:arginyl-tRNA synthetase